MKDTAEYTIGATVTATDGDCGTLVRLVLDPIAEVVTHLVIEPPHHHGPARLVPLELFDPAGITGDRLRLRGTVADLSRLDAADETHFMPPPPGYTPLDQTLVWPYYGGGAAVPPGMAGMVTAEHLPVGEVDVRRGDGVHAADGEIGRVEGLVVTRSDRQVTHVLLQEGHVFGRKEVAIPISAVRTMSNGVQLSITKEQVRDLPAVDHDRPG